MRMNTLIFTVLLATQVAWPQTYDRRIEAAMAGWS
jgi:hypothetical protein